jgi:hypothetical protein
MKSKKNKIIAISLFFYNVTSNQIKVNRTLVRLCQQPDDGRFQPKNWVTFNPFK